MDTEAYVSKGTRLSAWWFEVEPVSLSGVQMKFGATQVIVMGTVRHIRSDHPTRLVNPTFLLDVEEGAGYEDHIHHCAKCGKEHVEVKPNHVVRVWSP